MRLCDDYGPFDFRSACVRDTWGALLPFSFFLALCLFSIPVPRFLWKVHAIVKAPFQEFITLHEAEALDTEVQEKHGELVEESVPLWRTLVCMFVGITKTFCWIVHGSYSLYKDPQSGVLPFFIALVWLYTVIRPIARPTATPPYDMFTIYLLFLGSAILQIGGLLYNHTVSSTPYPLPLIILALSSNLVQSSAYYVLYSACLSQFPATSSIHLISCVIPLVPLIMANIR